MWLVYSKQQERYEVFTWKVIHRNLIKMEILVTGAAGFIGYHTCKRLLESGFHVTGLDQFDATDPVLKILQSGRLKNLCNWNTFHLVKGNILDGECLKSLFNRRSFSQVVHLAARTGVRESFEEAEQ